MTYHKEKPDCVLDTHTHTHSRAKFTITANWLVAELLLYRSTMTDTPWTGGHWTGYWSSESLDYANCVCCRVCFVRQGETYIITLQCRVRHYQTTFFDHTVTTHRHLCIFWCFWTTKKILSTPCKWTVWICEVQWSADGLGWFDYLLCGWICCQHMLAFSWRRPTSVLYMRAH